MTSLANLRHVIDNERRATMSQIPNILAAEETNLSTRLSSEWREAITSILHQNKIVKAAVFGSILDDTFERGSSDLDLLVTFPENTSYFDVAKLKMAIEERLAITVDIASWKAIANDKNPLRRSEILDNTRLIYEDKAA